MSEEKFSSRPPSLPMPSTISGTAPPSVPRAVPNTGCRCNVAAVVAARRLPSAKSETARRLSSTPARPAMSRHAIRTIARRRQMRSRRSATSAVGAAAAAASISRCADSAASGVSWRISQSGSSGSRIRAAAANSLQATTRGSSVRYGSPSAASAAVTASFSRARSHHRRSGSRSGSFSTHGPDSAAALVRSAQLAEAQGLTPGV